MRGPVNDRGDEERSWQCHLFRQGSPILHLTPCREPARPSQSPDLQQNSLTHRTWASGWCTQARFSSTCTKGGRPVKGSGPSYSSPPSSPSQPVAWAGCWWRRAISVPPWGWLVLDTSGVEQPLWDDTLPQTPAWSTAFPCWWLNEVGDHQKGGEAEARMQDDRS